MEDLFNHPILCKGCRTEMENKKVIKDRFVLRVKVCPDCSSSVCHPNDEAEYNKFIKLKNKNFRVKMRLVGNSYAVSIPKEIVSFIREQEKIMDNMVRLCFEESGRLSLNFGDRKNA